ncbi:MAG: Glycosyl transferase family 2 [Microgenomates group bacterium GW2011_GWC1_46_16]|uniref:Glycosyltransferase 2-like domain-containing protein n=2 Tax=Candidatus Collieribacteriota TaxID=1752725 RepID=A0A1F5FY04_9BACT|nr:MAG: Glycosyl transferase family 2 [Microgenomates group bacterium GW2011_GWF1_46_12]KKU26714.1 MAG: Glycosyl transferase family 2 [Microgenomates group bacterium GW2011_GWC1_46_16]KKU27559.1 MAG: Glycosyl transferase family 2 [Microgenomates group bacterium GW2011_GWF2_46_18]KKU43598.1 MAG: Glycosyl transferase family 2 [Microgenomates group bacterium GW2011_GWA1_46_7]KKU45100.1 MAG: Glycosyl transferase family 2 [Microgenomates group bacterium GW2011_GWB1_46_7]KKU60454.1 MAG: Glycosyl tra
MQNKKLHPLVSVIMTAYNADKFVGQAVGSIQAQTYPNLELIVVNDGSVDNTLSVVRKIAQSDKRIKVISYDKNRGASYASNLALDKARGKLIARMDADDIAIVDRFEKQVNYLLSNPEAIAVGGQCELIDSLGKSIGEKSFPLIHTQIYSALYQYNPVQHPTIMVNTKLLGKHKLVYHSDVVLAHDLELLFFLAQYGQLANLPDTILQYRIHNDSLSLRNPKKTFYDTIAVRSRAVKKYGYVPNLRGQVMGLMQQMIVGILPNVIIYPLFHLIRMSQVGDVKTLVLSTGRYTTRQIQLRLAGMTAAIATWLVR